MCINTSCCYFTRKLIIPLVAGLVPPAGRPIKLLDIRHYLLLNFDAVAAGGG